ncbi:MAG: hypothetical protein V1659_03550 [Candidatus Woesearchaeota archaeon]
MSIEFDIRPCITGVALSAVPKKSIYLDFKLIKQSFEVVIDAKLLLIIKINDEEIIAHSNGELKFKTLKDEQKIKKTASLIYATAASEKEGK